MRNVVTLFKQNKENMNSSFMYQLKHNIIFYSMDDIIFFCMLYVADDQLFWNIANWSY